jgi:hypothetical protein
VFGAELAFDVWVDSAEILCYLESIHYNYCTTNKLSYNCMNKKIFVVLMMVYLMEIVYGIDGWNRLV